MTYRSELVQVAAVCLAAAQVAETDTSSLLKGDAEGLRGRWSLEHLLNEVRAERERQEVKWGVRHGEDATPLFWFDVLLEEVGEIAEEIVKTYPTAIDCSRIHDALKLGVAARAILELR